LSDYQLLAIDIDGTLLNDRKEIPEANIKWIQKLNNRNIPIILTTGRGYQRVEHVLKKLNINQPMVLVNGAEIWTDQMTLLNRIFIPRREIEKLRKISIKYGVHYWGYATEGMFKEKYFDNDMMSWKWLKFGLKYKDISVIKQAKEEIISTTSIEVTSSNKYNIECAPTGVTKKSGLIEICNHLNISMQKTIAVGDQLNDLTMIQTAGKGIAMGNATESLKKIADTTTLTNNQSGVAEVIKNYFF